MVHLNTTLKHDYKEPEVLNHPCQHAFVLVGHDPIFGVHMTQYHCEKHKYQLIFRIKLSAGKGKEDPTREYLRQRDLYPDDTFVLCNLIEDKCTIPGLGSGQRKTFKGAIYRGFRPPKTEPPAPDWFPWNDEDTIPVEGLGPVDVEIEHVVLYRPFFQNETPPPVANYLVWGGKPAKKGAEIEAHMTNFQTGTNLSGKFEVPLYGLDVDHVMSLTKVPEWLDTELLIAGTPVSVPAIPRMDPETGDPIVLPKPPMGDGDHFEVLYRGNQPPRALIAGHSFFWGSMVCNSEGLLNSANTSLIISAMPRKYWK